MSRTTIFVTGATGYIGGAVLNALLNHKDSKSFHLKALVRNKDKAKKLESFGVDVIVGSLSDGHLVEAAASESDIVITMADVDDHEACKSILRGLKQHNERTGKVPILIHTSGTGVLADNAGGLYAGEKIYNDAKVEDIESLAPTQIHRPVDLEVVSADLEGYAKCHIILPSTIYGIVSNPLVDAGIQNPQSVQVPALIRASIDRQQAGMVGLGVNIWPNVEINELVDLYIILFDKSRSGADIGHGRTGFYFGASAEHSLYAVGKAIGEALVKLGKSSSDVPTTFTKQEIDKYFGGSDYLGSNSRCIPQNSKSLGWTPVKTTEDLLASILPEVELELKKNSN